MFIDRVNSRINPVEEENGTEASDEQNNTYDGTDGNAQEPTIENQVNGEFIENDESSEKTGDLYTRE